MDPLIGLYLLRDDGSEGRIEQRIEGGAPGPWYLAKIYRKPENPSHSELLPLSELRACKLFDDDDHLRRWKRARSGEARYA